MTRLSGTLAVALAVLGVLLLADSAQAQRRGFRQGQGFGPGPGGFMMGGGGEALFLLANPQIQREIDLLEEQKEKIDDIRARVFSEMREGMADRGDLSREERDQRMREMQQRRAERMKKIDEEIGKILLPHQQKRLDDIQALLVLRQLGPNAFESDAVRKVLQLNEDQREKLRRIGEETRDKLEEAQRKISDEAKKQAMGVLTAEQKETVERLEKDKFQLDLGPMGPGGRRRGGPIGGPPGPRRSRPER
jgi:Spy/CpxP family protein refolding chaperone